MRKILLIIFLLIGTQSVKAQSKLVSFYKKGIILNVYKDSSRTQPIFQLKPGFRFQTRFETSGDMTGTQDWESNFIIRRARLKFDGFVLSPNLVYKVELALSPDDLKSSSDYRETKGSSKVLLNAVGKWRFYHNKKHSLTLWFGQSKLPGNRQRSISSSKLQLVDRSSLNSIFNIDRDLGAQVHGKFTIGKTIIKPIFAFSKGEGRNVIINNIGGFQYTGRLEVLPMGEFTGKGDFFEADLKRENNPKLSTAVSVNFNQGHSKQKATGVFLLDTSGNYLTNDLLTVFGDMMFKYRGLSILGEYAFKKVLNTGGDIVSESGKSYYTGYGLSGQVGYLFKYNIELVGRYSMVVPDWEKSFTGSNEYTLGLSKYIVGHKLKVQTDITLIDRNDVTNHDLRYRLQMEFSF